MHCVSFNVLAASPPQGFNRSFAGQNATLFGKGVYFAANASYSADDTYRHAPHTRVLNPRSSHPSAKPIIPRHAEDNRIIIESWR
jgi:hypothetical protein